MKFIFTLLALLAMSVTFAQAPFESAQITLSNGRKITVEVKKDVDSRLAKGVEYRKNEGAPLTRLSPGEIRSIIFEEGQRWDVVSFENPLDSNKTTTVLGKYLVKGKYHLYALPIYQNQHYLLRDPGGKQYYLYNDEVRPNGERLRLGNFTDGLAQLSSSCPDMKGRAEKTVYGDREVSNFVADLNRCSGQEPEVFYQKQKTETQLKVFAGGLVLGQDKLEGFGQFMVRFRKPDFSRKVTLNTGLNAAFFRGTDEEEFTGLTYNQQIWYLSIPVTVQYNFTETKFQPYLNAGLSMLFRQVKYSIPELEDNSLKKSLRPAFVIAVGAEWNISKAVFLKGEWRYEYFRHYPFVGVGINL